jgi:hypothetical protein
MPQYRVYGRVPVCKIINCILCCSATSTDCVVVVFMWCVAATDKLYGGVSACHSTDCMVVCWSVSVHTAFRSVCQSI